MKNSLINNKGISLLHEKKTKLEVQIAELQAKETQISQQLRLWESKAKRANAFANYLELAEAFAAKFLTEAVESENNREQTNKYLLESLIRNQVEFNLKFEAGAEVFAKLVLEKLRKTSK